VIVAVAGDIGRGVGYQGRKEGRKERYPGRKEGKKEGRK
jgi:hypothetical protein